MRALAGVIALAALAACSRGEGAPRVIVGAGATLPAPLYARWASELAKVDRSVRIDYHAIGSGAGLRQMDDGVVDFGASDEPLLPDSATRERAPRLAYVPTTLGAVAIVHSAPGATELRLTPELVSAIFLGQVTRWDDARLARENPGALPSGPITVVHRADGSGTTAALTSYLSKTSDEWRARVGAGTSPRFPVGAGMSGNDGVASFVKSTPLSIGYVELAFARQAGLPAALVKNRAGRYVAPSLDALERAARTYSSADADDGAYPIVAVSYVVVKTDAADRTKGEALAKFLWWAVHDGQKLAPPLEYAPLPPDLVSAAERAVRGLRVGGKPVLLAGAGG
jgi:phosphate transport system substrate-binding protein